MPHRDMPDMLIPAREVFDDATLEPCQSKTWSIGLNQEAWIEEAWIEEA